MTERKENDMTSNKGRRFANLIAGAIAMAAVTVGSALPAFAASDSFNKKYTVFIPSGETESSYKSPAETFKFASGAAGTTGTENKASFAALKATTWNTNTTDMQEVSSFDTAGANADPAKYAAITTDANIPQTVTIGTAAYAEGGATSAGANVAVTVTPEGTYTKPGVYYYDFHEVVGSTAGVNYNNDSFRVGVTVEKQGGALTPVHITLIDKSEKNKKADNIQNSYSAGKLTFTKKVTGNMGDTDKQFTVKVSLTAPAISDTNTTKKTVSSVISVVGNDKAESSEMGSINPADWTGGTVEKTYTVKDGTSITLTNIPEGVSCLVKENDYSGEGYTTTYLLNGSDNELTDANLEAKKMGNAGSIAVTITNTNETTIDAGVFTTNLPYILILLAAVAGAVVFVVVSRKRRA